MTTFTLIVLFVNTRLNSLEKVFNALIDSYIENKIGIATDFLNESLAKHLKDNLTRCFDQNKFLMAGTGQFDQVEHNHLTRSDQIYWLDRTHDDEYENSFFDLMDLFVAHLNATCYTGIKSYEFHYTLYGAGSFYAVHLDQFRNNDSRQYSMIMYLNDQWQEQDGGELCIHSQNHIQLISPVNGKSVFFKSNELRHEVLVTHKPRMSITGWLKS